MIRELRYFSAEGDPKLACQCGCGLGIEDMSAAFMKRLDAARHQAGVPFIVTSGIRCPEHNNDVSSSGFDGPHTTGKAVDLAFADVTTRFAIWKALIELGFERFGVNAARQFLHVDGAADIDKGRPSKRIWFYD